MDLYLTETVVWPNRSFSFFLTQEIVILDINHLYGMTQEQHRDLLENVVLATLGEKVADDNTVGPASKVREYWDNKFQVVVLYNRKELDFDSFHGKVWHPSLLVSQWPEANDAVELKSKLCEYVHKRSASNSQNNNKFFVLQGVLTPDAELIKKEIMSGGGLVGGGKNGISIKSFSGDCNCKVVDWISGEEDDDDHHRGGDGHESEHSASSLCCSNCYMNIVIVDFFENCSLLPAVILSNRS